MSRFWRRLFGLLLGLVLLLALALVVEHWRGRRILAATVADLKAQGRLPVPEELFAPPGASNGIHLLTAAAGRLRNPPAPSSMQGVAPGRAVEGFQLTWWEDYRKTSNTWDTFAAWGEARAADLDQLQRALAQPECRATIDWRQGFNALLPALVQQKDAAIALAADALLAAHEGDKEGALANLETLGRLEQALAREPLLISQLVRIACAAIPLPRIWDIAQRDDWTEADLAALQAAMPSTNFSVALVESLRGEAALWEVTVRKLRPEEYLHFGTFGAATDDLTLPTGLEEVPSFAGNLLGRFARGLRSQVYFPLWRFAWQDQAIAFHLRAMDDLCRRCAEAGEARSLQKYGAVEDDDFSFLGGEPVSFGDVGLYDRLRFHLTYMSLPALQKAIAKALRLETERALIETGIALRRHRLRHGRLPERLEQLVPDFLAAVPVDGMDGRPLRYRVNADGTYALWSVGEDFVDDGGDFTPPNPKASTLRWWNAKDAVLPLRASDVEVAQWDAAETAKWLKQQQRRASGTNGAPTMSLELMRRYGLLPATTNAPAMSAELMRGYGLLPAATNAPPSPPPAP